MVSTNNYAGPLQCVQERSRSPQRLQTHSVSPSLQFKGAKENSHNGAAYEPRPYPAYEPRPYPEELNCSTPTNNLLNLMREQLELATKAYSARFAEEIRRTNEYARL